jgi:exopolyphosphatase/guanosine-5'-triphosphate,3'-diphosphate pyrophosphatase
MIIGAIDLGTNTFDLLLAQFSKGKLEVLYREKQWVGIGTGMYPSMELTEESLQRAIPCLIRFIQTANEFNVDILRACGTSALRDAVNSKAWCDELHEKTGLNIDVISGTQEAKLVYSGIKMLSNITSDGIVMDIGGGSTELIVFRNDQLNQVFSLNIGVTRLLTELDFNYPLSEDDIVRFEMLFNEESKRLLPITDTLIGAAGAFETFFWLLYKESIRDGIFASFDLLKLAELLDQLIHTSYQQRLALDGVPDVRRKYLHLAALEVRWLIKTCGINQVMATTSGLCEGIITEIQESFERLD